ncbi:MAG TPA: hypothetical protein VN041_13990 [Microbacterium sp.]|nr:hypothetical protein [Microbacterium sp.]
MVTIQVSKSSPYVTFTVPADRSSTNIGGNSSTMWAYLQMSKGSGSFFNGDGLQIASIDGVGEFARYGASPFLPSGMTGWNYGAYYLTASHNADGTRSVTVRMTLDYGTINESHTAVLVLPTIPKTPTGLTVTRVSDTQQTLNWASASVNTSAVVQRSTDGGAWQQVGAPSGNAKTFTDTTTTGNHRYEYRGAVVAGAGQSSWSSTATIYTTPSVPAAPSAARDGMDIVISGSFSAIATGVDVQDGATVVASNVTLPWRDVAPDPGTPHTYKVRAVRGSLASPWSPASNTVQLIAPPNPPVSLAPNGGVVASDVPVVLSWTHNPVDSSTQSAFELQWRPSGGAWTTVSGTTASDTSVTLPTGGFEWQVRTKGTDPSFSDWSAVATVTVIDRPGVAVTQPADVWPASTLEVEWSWFQAQGRPQSAWRVELLDATGQVVESRDGSGPTSSYVLAKRLTEGQWTVRVMGATGGVWSIFGTETFMVAFVPPEPPELSGVWDDMQGGVALTLAGDESAVAVLDGDAWYVEAGA